MSRFQPFRALRYDPARVDLADVTVPPYDVIDEPERQRLVDRHVDSAVRIDLPVAEPGEAGDVYQAAAALLDDWQGDGILIRDEVPGFYGYRMSYPGLDGERRHTTGVFGALALGEPGDGHILPHEFTTPKAKSDRLRLTQATHANLSAVWGLSASAGLTDLIAPGDAPVTTWTDEAGVEHSLWPIFEPERLAAITGLTDASPVVIADGHHRYETALTYRTEQREQGVDGDPGAESVLLYLVELAEDELTVLPIHRLLSGLPDAFDLREALAPFFDIEPAPPLGPDLAPAMAAAGALTLVLPDGAWFLVPTEELNARARDLDTSRLDVALASLPPHDLVFQHGVDHVVDRVRDGDAQAGVLLRPATVGQILEIAHGGERMPPKTTFFHPKPRTGVVFRLLDE